MPIKPWHPNSWFTLRLTIGVARFLGFDKWMAHVSAITLWCVSNITTQVHFTALKSLCALPAYPSLSQGRNDWSCSCPPQFSCLHCVIVVELDWLISFLRVFPWLDSSFLHHTEVFHCPNVHTFSIPLCKYQGVGLRGCMEQVCSVTSGCLFKAFGAFAVCPVWQETKYLGLLTQSCP